MHSIARCLVAFGTLGSLAATAAAQDKLTWPQFRGPRGMAVSTDKNVPVTWGPMDNIAWKVPLPGAGTSSPIVVGDKIFLACYSGYAVPGERGNIEQLKRHLVCLNRNNGTILWSKTLDAKLPEQERIRDDHGYASSTPVADNEHVYAFFGKSGVYAFTHDGKQVWQADVGNRLNGWGSAASPILYQDLVIVNASVESDSLIAFDKKTGKEQWRANGIRESWNTPLLVSNGDKTELVVGIFRKLLAFDPENGKPLWSCNTEIDWYMVPSLVADNGVVYCIGGRSGGALAVRAGGSGDVTKTHRLWTGRKGSNVSSPILYQGHLYWAHENTGVVYCAEAKTGNIVYEERLAGAAQFYPSPVLANGNLYYLARNGRTIVVAAKPKFEKLATNELGERGAFNSSPAVADGQLLIRSDRFLYAIGKKGS